MIENQRVTADVPAFEPGAPHAGADALDDKVALEFGDGPTMITRARPSGPPVSICSGRSRTRR